MIRPLNKNDRIYLASPYTSDVELEELRYRQAREATAILLKAGYICFSPIVHSHPIAVEHKMVERRDLWMRQCKTYIRYWATAGIVLKLPGWKYSTGIEEELDLMFSAGTFVYYHTLDELSQLIK